MKKHSSYVPLKRQITEFEEPEEAEATGICKTEYREGGICTEKASGICLKVPWDFRCLGGCACTVWDSIKPDNESLTGNTKWKTNMI